MLLKLPLKRRFPFSLTAKFSTHSQPSSLEKCSKRHFPTYRLLFVLSREPCQALAMKSRVSSLLTQFHSSQRCGSVEQSDKVRILSHFPPVMNPLSFFTQFYTSQRCGSVEKSDKVRILSHFPPLMNPLSFFTQFYTSRTSGKRKVGILWPALDICGTIRDYKRLKANLYGKIFGYGYCMRLC